MTPVATTVDLLATLAAIALAAAFLIVRGVRVWRRRGAGGCACPSADARGGAGGCGAARGPSADDLRAAAARGARRAASDSRKPPPR